MSAPVRAAFSPDHARAAFTLFHEKGNILTAEMVASLRTALEGVVRNRHLKLITIEGAGPDFSFGASIPEHTPGEIDRVLPDMHALIYDLLDLPTVTAALVRGRCVGGGFELALACDFIFAEETATFALPEIRLGVFPPAASALLPQRVGLAQATAGILTGATTSAEDWHARGLVQMLAPAGTLDAAVAAWFDTHLAAKSAAALRHAISAIRMPLQSHVRELLPKLERLYLQELMHTHDAVEGIDAFLARRRPSWTDD